MATNFLASLNPNLRRDAADLIESGRAVLIGEDAQVMRVSDPDGKSATDYMVGADGRPVIVWRGPVPREEAIE